MKVRNKKRDDRGQALVEFILVFPILLVVVFAFIYMGQRLDVRSKAYTAAKQGVSRATLYSSVSEANSIANRYGTSYAEAAMGYKGSTIKITETEGNTYTCTVTITYRNILSGKESEYVAQLTALKEK